MSEASEDFGVVPLVSMELVLLFLHGASLQRILYDSDPSFRPDKTKLIFNTYSVSERRPRRVLL